MKYYLLTISMILYLLNMCVAKAETIRWVTESWQNYTNEDGSGLYQDIMREIFTGHKLEITTMPWKRSFQEVKNGTADVTGATSSIDGYITSRYAMLAPPISILFDKNKMIYKEMQSLSGYVGVWPSPYEEELIAESNKAFIKGFSVLSRDTAYKLLLSGRADYFIDTKALHQAWLASNPNSTISAANYQIKDVSRLNLYMIFSDSARGMRLKNIFDKGMTRLIENGQLRNIYEKYNFLEQMPTFPQL